MNRSVLFYIWVAINSYLSGPIVYVASLWIIYGEKTNDLKPLITWTAFAFFSVGLLSYLLSVIFLRSINRYYFWSQTLLFVLMGGVPVAIILFIMGSFNAANFTLVFSPEGLIFFLSFTGMALLASYGTWITQKGLNKKPFIFISIVVIALFILVTK